MSEKNPVVAAVEAISNATEAVILFAGRTMVWGWEHPASSSFIMMGAGALLSWHSFDMAGHHSVIQGELLQQANQAQSASDHHFHESMVAMNAQSHALNHGNIQQAKTDLRESRHESTVSHADGDEASFLYNQASGQSKDRFVSYIWGVSSTLGSAASTGLGVIKACQAYSNRLASRHFH